MEIKTKFSIGDNAVMLNRGGAMDVEIVGITFREIKEESYSREAKTEYLVIKAGLPAGQRYASWWEESNNLFASRADLASHILKPAEPQQKRKAEK